MRILMTFELAKWHIFQPKCRLLRCAIFSWSMPGWNSLLAFYFYWTNSVICMSSLESHLWIITLCTQAVSWLSICGSATELARTFQRLVVGPYEVVFGLQRIWKHYSQAPARETAPLLETNWNIPSRFQKFLWIFSTLFYSTSVQAICWVDVSRLVCYSAENDNIGKSNGLGV